MKITDFDNWCTYMYEENCLERHRNGQEAFSSKEEYVSMYSKWLKERHKQHLKENNWSESIYLS
mgnify:FL=1|jgi:hypothetical protein|tara:strand:- start:2834 stop:3025 length:192 start_codon:yes stop_codon:yes gene_type:complete